MPGIIAGIVAVTAVAAVVGYKLLAKRSTEATVPLTAKLPGKVAVVYYSQKTAPIHLEVPVTNKNNRK